MEIEYIFSYIYTILGRNLFTQEDRTMRCDRFQTKWYGLMNSMTVYLHTIYIKPIELCKRYA
jgi:hypothetical protein